MKEKKVRKLAVAKMPTVKQRITMADRVDAVRRLQNIGEQRRAQMFHQGLKDEHDRLSGVFHSMGDVSGLRGKIHNLKKLMVGLIQALVFTLLTAVFTSLMCTHSEEHADEGGHH